MKTGALGEGLHPENTVPYAIPPAAGSDIRLTPKEGILRTSLTEETDICVPILRKTNNKGGQGNGVVYPSSATHNEHEKIPEVRRS